MSNSLFTLLRDAGRLALYSLVLGPALLLYGIVVNIAMEGSLSEQFVQEARNLTEGAPAGKVMQCIAYSSPEIQPQVPNPGEDISPQPYKVPTISSCHREPVDPDLWIKPVDATLFNFWLIAALFGAFLGFMSLLRLHRPEPVTRNTFVLQKKEQHDEC